MRLTPAYAGVAEGELRRVGADEWGRSLGERLGPLVDQLEAKKAYELAFALVDGCGAHRRGAREPAEATGDARRPARPCRSPA